MSGLGLIIKWGGNHTNPVSSFFWSFWPHPGPVLLLSLAPYCRSSSGLVLSLFWLYDVAFWPRIIAFPSLVLVFFFWLRIIACMAPCCHFSWPRIVSFSAPHIVAFVLAPYCCLPGQVLSLLLWPCIVAFPGSTLLLFQALYHCFCSSVSLLSLAVLLLESGFIKFIQNSHPQSYVLICLHD